MGVVEFQRILSRRYVDVKICVMTRGLNGCGAAGLFYGRRLYFEFILTCFCRRLQVTLDAEKQTVSSLRKEIEDKHTVELQRQEKNAEKNRALMRHATVLLVLRMSFTFSCYL